MPDSLIFEGDAESKTLDLTRRSWRHPSNEFLPGPQTSSTLGPLTCPFCEVERSPSNPPAEPTLDISPVGEGRLTVAPYHSVVYSAGGDPSPLINQNAPTQAGAESLALVPFTGAL